MSDSQNKSNHIAAGGDQAAELNRLEATVAQHPDDADAWVALGKEAWRIGLRGRALTALNTAYTLDPAPGTKALIDHLNGIMDFFCTDFYNP